VVYISRSAQGKVPQKIHSTPQSVTALHKLSANSGEVKIRLS